MTDEIRRWRSPMMEACTGAFQRAAAGAATFELRMRLSAELVPELRDHSFDKMSKLAPRFVEHFKVDLTPDDARLVLACAHLRSKVLHLELGHATGILLDLGQELIDAEVTAVKFDTGAMYRGRRAASASGDIRLDVEGAPERRVRRGRPRIPHGHRRA